MLFECFQLFFPKHCPSCSKALLRNENIICFHCRYALPRTGFHLQRGNPVEQLFWGRVPLQAAAACFEFRKSGGVQRMLHQLKYDGAQDLGRELGRIYGRELLQSPLFSENQIIVPVPLHPDRLRIRGYNQSEVFAEGLEESLPIAKLNNAIERVVHTSTQTKKSRFDRWQNVETAFEVTQVEAIRGKRVLLVDDVVTTGATLESCAARLLRSGAENVSIACIAATR
jgi:ComF family protein